MSARPPEPWVWRPFSKMFDNVFDFVAGMILCLVFIALGLTAGMLLLFFIYIGLGLAGVIIGRF